jgi:MFS family permease
MAAIFTFIWIYFFGKYSKLKVFLLSSLIWTIGTILFTFSENYFQVLILSAIIGIGVESSSIMILMILFQVTSKKSEGKMLATFIGVQGAGSLFGVLITAYVEDILNLSLNYIFLIIGIISLSWVCLSGFLFLRITRKNEEIDTHLDKIKYRFNLKKFLQIIKKRSNLALIILFLYSVPFIFFFSLWLQKYFLEIHSLSQMEAAMSYVFLTGAEFLGMIFGGFLFDKLYSKNHYKKIYLPVVGIAIAIPLLIIGFSLSWERGAVNSADNLIEISLNLFNFAISDSIVFISYIFLFLGFFFFAFIYPFSLLVINDCNSQEEVAPMLGMQKLLEIVGQSISPLIGGLIADKYSTLMVMLTTSIFLFLPIINLLLVKKTFEKDFLSNLNSDSKLY